MARPGFDDLIRDSWDSRRLSIPRLAEELKVPTATARYWVEDCLRVKVAADNTVSLQDVAVEAIRFRLSAYVEDDTE